MIIKIWLREKNLIYVSYEQNYSEMNKDPRIHKHDCYQSTFETIFWFYSNCITHMLTQINWVNTFGTQITQHYGKLTRYYIVKYYVFI